MTLPQLLILARARQGIAESAEIGLRWCELASSIAPKDTIAFGFHNAAGDCRNPCFEANRVKAPMAFGLPDDSRAILIEALSAASNEGFRTVDYTGAMVDKPGFTWVGLKHGGWRHASVRVDPQDAWWHFDWISTSGVFGASTRRPSIIFFDASNSQAHTRWGNEVRSLGVPLGVEPGPVGAAIGHPDVPTIMRYGDGGKVTAADFEAAKLVHPNTYALVMDRERYSDTGEMELIGRRGGRLAVMTLGRSEDKFRALVEAWWKGRGER